MTMKLFKLAQVVVALPVAAFNLLFLIGVGAHATTVEWLMYASSVVVAGSLIAEAVLLFLKAEEQCANCGY